jgi:hypothetical protein
MPLRIGRKVAHLNLLALWEKATAHGRQVMKTPAVSFQVWFSEARTQLQRQPTVSLQMLPLHIWPALSPFLLVDLNQGMDFAAKLLS